MEFVSDVAGAEEGDGFAEAEGHEEEGTDKWRKSHTIDDDCAELVSESVLDLENFEGEAYERDPTVRYNTQNAIEEGIVDR